MPTRNLTINYLSVHNEQFVNQKLTKLVLPIQGNSTHHINQRNVQEHPTSQSINPPDGCSFVTKN